MFHGAASWSYMTCVLGFVPVPKVQLPFGGTFSRTLLKSQHCFSYDMLVLIVGVKMLLRT